MLSTYTSFLYIVFSSFIVLFIVLALLLNKAKYAFYKIWIVFAYLVTLSLILGYCGEDFFVIVVLAAEIPVFFAFFFFCVTKTQMSVVADSRRVKPLTKNKIILLVLVLVINTITITPQNSFCYYTPTYLVDVVQRSDFFIFYFSFFILEGSFIIFIGLLITVVTLIILFFTFKNQITAAGGVKKTATMSWVRIQDTQVQNSQKRSFVFFRI